MAQSKNCPNGENSSNLVTLVVFEVEPKEKASSELELNDPQNRYIQRTVTPRR
jgi:hypothetical protein